MSAQNIRIMKETRALFWPWCGVMLLAVLQPFVSPLAYGKLFGEFGIAGFYLGLPLIAALPFGSEFQYRTLPLLFAQPISFLKVWREKFAVMAIGITSLALAYYFVWRSFVEQDIMRWVFALAFLTATVGSSVIWVLIARSTIGGVILNVAVQGIAIAAWIGLAQIAAAQRHMVNDAFPILSAGFAGTVCYAGVMLWVGFRKFSHFQVTGVIASEDFLSTAAPLARWFYWRPVGATANLIKKEMRLLRPVWLLALLLVAFSLCLVPLRLLPGSDVFVADAGVAFVGGYLLLATILAGSLSIGEERQSGTHSWHLTLPLSIGEQWLMKFVLGSFVAVACGFVVVQSAEFLLGPPFKKLFEDLITSHHTADLLVLGLLTFTSAFWCSCAVNGTIRAAAWTVPAVTIFGFIVQAGLFAGELRVFRSLVQDVVLSVHAFPPSHELSYLLFRDDLGLVLSVPAVAFAILQSYRLFRMERPESIWAIVRPLTQICLVAFLYLFAAGLFIRLIGEVDFEQTTVLREVGGAVNRLPLDPATVDSAHPRAITTEDLANVYPLSNMARIWLGNASISVSLPPKPRGGFNVFRPARFEANLHFSNGSECQAYAGLVNCVGPKEKHPPLWPFFE